MPKLYFLLFALSAWAQPSIRADSSLVIIPTHVTTPSGTSVTSLRKDNFRLIEDNVEQKIAHFSQDDAPVSIGLLFDASGSMRHRMQKASEAALSFFKTSNPADEFFLIEFNDRARLTVPFTPDSGQLYQRIVRTRSFGRTCLFDAIHLALAQMKHASNARKALVILSDGGDNWSRHNVSQIRGALLESGVQLYAIGIFDPNEAARPTREEKDGPELLSELADQSGGRHYPVANLNDLPDITSRLGINLRNEYLLGYYSNKSSRDGKYHKIQVTLAVSDNTPPLRTYHRRGYYAPSE